MIPRYARQEMMDIWTDERKFSLWLELETLAAEKMADLGLVPASVPKNMREKGQFDIERIHEIEQETKHDVIAFLTNVAEYVGDDARFVHQGMTSSDILDSCFNIQLCDACDMLLKGLERLLEALKKVSYEHKETLMIGRSHGIHAEPISFGLKMAGFYAETKRNYNRLVAARDDISTVALSGAVGTFAHIPLEVEEYVAHKLNMRVEPHSTQVIPRDRHAMVFVVFGVVASSLERLAVEIRHLQRSELGEVEEYFSKGQKGSSAMPHKRNPVLSENVTGLARLVRGYVMPALENVALWHERDISHSSVERVAGPDACVILDFAIHRMASLVENMVVYPDNMLRNMHMFHGLHNSQRVLLALTQAGISREDAYKLVQENAMKAWQDSRNLCALLLEDARVMNALSADELQQLFDDDHHIRRINGIFDRVFAA